MGLGVAGAPWIPLASGMCSLLLHPCAPPPALPPSSPIYPPTHHYFPIYPKGTVDLQPLTCPAAPRSLPITHPWGHR